MTSSQQQPSLVVAPFGTTAMAMDGSGDGSTEMAGSSRESSSSYDAAHEKVSSNAAQPSANPPLSSTPVIVTSPPSSSTNQPPTNSSLTNNNGVASSSGSSLHAFNSSSQSLNVEAQSPKSGGPGMHRRQESSTSNNGVGFTNATPSTPVHPQFTLKPEEDNEYLSDGANGGGNVIKRKKSIKAAKKKKWHVNAMGEIIYKEHNSYNLMRQIQLGIRSAISEIMPKKQKDVLLLKDFTHINKMPFPEKGTTRTPPHDFPYFDFYDYSPFPFRHLRERFGIDASAFLVCLCHEQSLSILGTPGKSGALFFFSADMQYMLKTVTKKESKFLRKILPDYYNHVMANPNTLITRFYGMYSIKPKGGKNVRFIIMNNVFDTTMYVSERYDLKGSTVGREASEKERKRETPVLKDLDFLKRGSKLLVGRQMKNLILHQLKVDAEWLERMKIMDYSLLVGVHRLDPDYESDVLKEAASVKLSDSDLPTEHNMFGIGLGHTSIGSSSVASSSSYLGGDGTSTAISSSLTQPGHLTEVHSGETVNHSEITIEVEEPKGQPSGSNVSASNNTSRKSNESTGSFFGRFMNPNRRDSVSLKKHYKGPRASLFQQFHGGTLSLPLEDGSREIYYFGIIDLLQKWNNKKQIENIFKGLVNDRNQISAVSPKNYASRFVKFLDDGLL